MQHIVGRSYKKDERSLRGVHLTLSIGNHHRFHLGKVHSVSRASGRPELERLSLTDEGLV